MAEKEFGVISQAKNLLKSMAPRMKLQLRQQYYLDLYVSI